jgi:RNA-binding protein Musashi
MREFFSQFGKVTDSTVMLDRETGRSKGFGFISLEDVDVTPILGFGNLEIDGKLVRTALGASIHQISLTIVQIDVKLAQPRFQREEGGGGGSGGGGGAGGQGRGTFGAGGAGGYDQAGGNFGNAGNATQGGGGTSGTPFDPQALAALYTRMFQVSGGMNPMMGGMGMGMGGMNPMMNNMGNMGGMGGMGGMGMGGMGRGMMGMGGNMGMGMGMGRGMGGGMGGQGMMGGNGGGMIPNAPRGPRGGPGGPGGAQAIAGPQAGVGPQRTGQRGQHNYHPYAR